VRRWRVAGLAQLLPPGALYLLVSPRAPVGKEEPNHGAIDADSRAKLLEVLREEREE
jgi:hypothetical protein